MITSLSYGHCILCLVTSLHVIQSLRQKEPQKKEVETQKKEVETQQQQSNTRIKKLEDQQQADNTQWKKTNEELNEAKSQLEIKRAENSLLQRELEKLLWNEQQKGEQADKDMKELVKKNLEWKKKLLEETTKREEAERLVETSQEHLKTANRHEVLEHHSHQEDSSSASGPVIDIGVDQQGRYISLTNTSNKEQQLGGWRLEMEVNRRNISHTFEKSFILSSGQTVSMSGPGCMSPPSTPDLWWKDFKSFSPTDELKFTLNNNNGEIRHELSSHSLNDSN